MKQVIFIILSALLMLLCLIGCASNVQSTQGTLQGTSNLPDPSTLNIAGDFNILIASNWNWKNDYTADEASSEVVDMAVYERNELIKQKYGVNIITEDISEAHKVTGSGIGFKKIYNDVLAGYTNYDAALIGTYDVATLAYTNLLTDLNTVPYVDLTKEHWDQKANADLSINGKMFYTTGEISLEDNRSVYTLFFSKNMVDSYKLDNPYELVNSGKWTLEKFSEMSKKVGNDKNSDGYLDRNDVYGFLTPTDTNLAILAAAGEKICSINENGEIELTLYSERTENLYSRYMELLNHSSTYNYQNDHKERTDNGKTREVSSAERIEMFDSERALFYSHTMFYVDELRQMENNFGILPYPKYDETQDGYYNLVSAWHSQFVCVPVLNKGLSRIGIVLEELAVQGDKLLTPAYYEKTLQGKYARDAESSDMLDIIFDSLVFDVGAYYNVAGYKDELGQIYKNQKSLTTIYESKQMLAENNISQINKAFSENFAN